MAGLIAPTAISPLRPGTSEVGASYLPQPITSQPYMSPTMSMPAPSTMAAAAGSSGPYGGSTYGAFQLPTQMMSSLGSRTQLAAPAPITADTPVNPMQAAAVDRSAYAYDRAKSYESGIADRTNEEITRELGRARDEISVGLKKEGESAMARGADPSLFRSRALEGGRAGLHQLQGRLADVALGRHAEANRDLAGAAGGTVNAAAAAASEQRQLHLGTMGQRLDEQRYLLQHAETQDRLNSAPYQRLASMVSLLGSYAGNYGGITGGSTWL